MTARMEERRTISIAIQCDKIFLLKLFAISLCRYYVSQSYFVNNDSTVYCISVIVGVEKKSIIKSYYKVLESSL